MPVSKPASRAITAGLWAGFFVCLVAVGAILFALYGPSTDIDTIDSPPAVGDNAPSSLTGPEPASVTGMTHKAATAAFVRSLPAQFEGTRVDGAITVGPDGNLAPTHAIRALFDYFISGYGDYSKGDQRQALRHTINRYATAQGVSADVRKQLLQLFDDYIRLRQRVVDESPSFVDADLTTRLHILEDMRIAELGQQTAQVFYGEEKKAMNQALAQHSGQTPPDSADDTNARANLPSRLAANVTEARKQGASAARVHAMRLKAVGAKATTRLEALDVRRNRWHAKYHDYARQRDAIRQSAMSTQDQRRAIQALRARSFQPAEQRRVRALDRIPVNRDSAS